MESPGRNRHKWAAQPVQTSTGPGRCPSKAASTETSPTPVKHKSGLCQWTELAVDLHCVAQATFPNDHRSAFPGGPIWAEVGPDLVEVANMIRVPTIRPIVGHTFSPNRADSDRGRAKFGRSRPNFGSLADVGICLPISGRYVVDFGPPSSFDSGRFLSNLAELGANLVPSGPNLSTIAEAELGPMYVKFGSVLPSPDRIQPHFGQTIFGFG